MWQVVFPRCRVCGQKGDLFALMVNEELHLRLYYTHCNFTMVDIVDLPELTSRALAELFGQPN